MPSDPLTCLDIAEELTGVADHDLVATSAGAHVAECLRCQAEVARYRRLARTMRAMATAPPAAPAGLDLEILVALDLVDSRRSRRLPARAAATVGGIAAAAGVIALAARGVTRQRRVGRLAV
jgi:hypothetical protein